MIKERRATMVKVNAKKHVRGCPECGSQLIVESGEGETVCGQCGLVISEEVYNMGVDWRAFTPEDTTNRSRAGPPASNLHADLGLATLISKDLTGHRATPTEMRRAHHLRQLQTWTMYQSAKERNLLQALPRLKGIADKLHISAAVREEAAGIYRKVMNQGLVRGRSIPAVVAASIYAACRLHSAPHQLDEVAAVSLVGWRGIARHYRLLVKGLELKPPLPDPKVYVSKVAAKAGISERAQGEAVRLLRKTERRNAIIGKGPLGLAAAALYVACQLTDEVRTQKAIAEAAGVTEVTVRNRYRCLKTDLSTLPNSDRISDAKNRGS